MPHRRHRDPRLLLAGCVYLRLRASQRQLADFDRSFRLQTDDGRRLGCLTPLACPSARAGETHGKDGALARSRIDVDRAREQSHQS